MARTLINAATQIRDNSILENLLSAELREKINQLVTTQASILDTMSTDTERVAAFEALQTAFQQADGTLQGALSQLVNQATTSVNQEQTRAQTAEAELKALVDALTSQVQSVASSLEANQAQTTTAIADLQALVDQKAQDLAALAAQVASQSTKQSELETALTSKLEAGRIRVAKKLIGTIDGTNKNFEVPEEFAEGTLAVYLNGVMQLEGTEDGSLDDKEDFTVSGKMLSFVGSPDPGDKLFASYVAA